MTTKSQDEKVQTFLDDLEKTKPEQFAIVRELRAIVYEHYPNVAERMMYGGIMFSLGEDFGGIFAYKQHISFEFSEGYQMQDPEKRLEGKGKLRRHLKIRSLTDIEAKKLAFFVAQAGSM